MKTEKRSIRRACRAAAHGLCSGLLALVLIAPGPHGARAQATAQPPVQATGQASPVKPLARAPGTPAPISEVREQARAAIWWGDFAALERQHERWRRSPERSPFGNLNLHLFRIGLGEVMDGFRGDGEAYRLHLVALTREWTEQHPRSSLAHALRANALTSLAWWYRGTGYANTVTPRAMALFTQRLEEAAQHLMKHGDVAFADSTAHVWFIDIALGLGWEPERVWAFVRQGFEKNPHDDRLYFAMLTRLLPKWGGSAQELDRFIVMATEVTKAARGDELYARLYSEAVAQQFETELFTESSADWARLQRGFRDWIERWPQPEFVNRFAYIACLAGDKAVFAEQVQRIAGQPAYDEWGSSGQEAYATCKRWGESS